MRSTESGLSCRKVKPAACGNEAPGYAGTAHGFARASPCDAGRRLVVPWGERATPACAPSRWRCLCEVSFRVLLVNVAATEAHRVQPMRFAAVFWHATSCAEPLCDPLESEAWTGDRWCDLGSLEWCARSIDQRVSFREPFLHASRRGHSS